MDRCAFILSIIHLLVTRLGSRAAVLPMLALSAAAGTWTDRNEYDLVLTLRSESIPQKRIELLDEWKAKYPKTELRQQRRELYLSAYQALNDEGQMFGIAGEMLSDQPDNPVGLYWYTILLPEEKSTTPELLQRGEKAATALLSNLNAYFAPTKKPVAIQDDAWQKQKTQAELLSHRTLGWIAWQRGNYAAAEQEFANVLQRDPKNAEISAWLGIVSGLQPDKRSSELWYLARATALRQDGALPEETRRRLHALLENIYVTYHGDTDGLDQLRSEAEANVMVPANFYIESAAVIAAKRNEEEISRTDPEMGAWLRIRRQLGAPDADKYFNESLRAAPLPKLRGTVIRCTPANKPEEVVIALTDSGSEDAVLKVSPPFRNEAKPGTRLEFEGLADSFQREPLMLRIVVDQDNVQGWPHSAPRSRVPR